MAGTGVRDVHVDQPLSQFMISYAPKGGVADKLVPRVSVELESNLVPYWKKGDMLRPVSDTRADGTRANRVDFATGKVPYVCIDHALETVITDRQRKNSKNQIDLERGKVQGTANIIRLNREIRVAALCKDASIAGADCTAKWSDDSTAIEEDVDTGKDAVRIGTGGLEANVMIIPVPVSRAAKRASELRELIRYTHADLLVNGDLPPVLFNLQVLVAGMLYCNTAQGQEELTFAEVWGDDVIIAHVEESANAELPSFAYSFNVVQEVRAWREEPIEADVFEPRDLVSETIVCPDCAYRIKRCLTKS